MKEIAYENDIEWNIQETKTELLNLNEYMIISAYIYYFVHLYFPRVVSWLGNVLKSFFLGSINVFSMIVLL